MDLDYRVDRFFSKDIDYNIDTDYNIDIDFNMYIIDIDISTYYI